jgi:lysophospholipase L1-like esterase
VGVFVVAGLAVLVALAAPARAAAKDVLVVGDSLEVGTGPYLHRALADEGVTVDAQKSRPSNVGVSVLRARLRPGDDVVVFDLGTNDDPAAPGRLAADLDSARQIAGDRCLVVATLNRPSVAALNRAVVAFARGSPNVELVDWHGAARQEPGLLGPDGIHATPAGYAQRARLIADGVEACLAGGASDTAPAPPRRGRPAAPTVSLRPSRIDWLAAAGLPGASGAISLARAAVSLVQAASRTTRAAVGGPLPEPVLGEP